MGSLREAQLCNNQRYHGNMAEDDPACQVTIWGGARKVLPHNGDKIVQCEGQLLLLSLMQLLCSLL